jgi:hypothetical protein
MTSISLHHTSGVRANTKLWIAQGVLAALFLFAGGMKLAVPAAALAAQSHLPGAFMKFIGVVETLGALGLILPGLFQIRPRLTPLAAAGLVVIMIGAVVTTIIQGPAAGAVVPAVVGVLAAYVARGRF